MLLLDEHRTELRRIARAGTYEGSVPRVLPKPYRSEALVDAVNAAIRTRAPATA